METLNSRPGMREWYRRFWRWHFYAGVFAIPFVIILSITGALYLFKPQFDAWHDRPYNNLGDVAGQLRATPEQQVTAALAALPGARLSAYQLPQAEADAVNILLDKNGKKFRAYIHPVNLQVLALEPESARFMQLVHDIHGELLLGTIGALLVELAACWAIVLVITGLYLWWPRSSKGLGGILYPRLRQSSRVFWRDLHSVTAIWIAIGVLFLLISGLPWATVWGGLFKELRQATSTMPSTATAQTNAGVAKPDWAVAGQGDHAQHQRSEHLVEQESPQKNLISLNHIVARAQALAFTHPVLVTPPSVRSAYWSIKSVTQNRPQRAEANVNAVTGELVDQTLFAQRHPIDKVIGYGIAIHEGQLFGWFNQLLGLLTALGLLVVSVSGFVLWRKRAPAGSLGAPAALPVVAMNRTVVATILLLAVLLPAFGGSLLLIALFERYCLPRLPRINAWLGC